MIGMLAVCWDSNLTKVAGEPHLWRQSDCISITQHYAAGAPFLEPEMHSRISDDGTSGKTIAEFPITYYIVGKIWAITGVHIWIFRLFSALFCIVALYCLYRALLLITKQWLWSALGPLLLLGSPVYAFYGISFLTNVPALNCIIIAWYMIAKYYYSANTKHFIVALLFFTLAGLLKISALNSFLVLFFVFILDRTRYFSFKKGEKFFQRPALTCALLFLPIVITITWYYGYVEYYCTLHGGRYSFNQPDPVWNATSEAAARFWKMWFGFTSQQVYPTFVWLLSAFAYVFLLMRYKSVNAIWLVSIPLVFLGHALFSLLFFYSLDAHDYYHIDLLIGFLLLYAALSQFASGIDISSRAIKIARVCSVLLISWLLLSCNNNMYLRFFGVSRSDEYASCFASEGTIAFLKMAHSMEWARLPYPEIADELDRRGYSDSTVVYSTSDGSFNITLLQLRRPGFTNMLDIWRDSSWTAWRIERGAEIMLVEQEFEGIVPFMDYPLFSKGQITVYDLKPYRAQSE